MTKPTESPEVPAPQARNVERVAGTVIRIVVSGGYFFARTAEGVDYFGHYTELLNATLKQMTPGDRVTFVPTEPPKGFRAIEIEWEGTWRK